MKENQDRAASKDSGAPTPRLRVPLRDQRDVARELARLYRSARAGLVPVGDASKLAHILHVLARVLDGGDLELRIEALESQQQPQGWHDRENPWQGTH